MSRAFSFMIHHMIDAPLLHLVVVSALVALIALCIQLDGGRDD